MRRVPLFGRECSGGRKELLQPGLLPCVDPRLSTGDEQRSTGDEQRGDGREPFQETSWGAEIIAREPSMTTTPSARGPAGLLLLAVFTLSSSVSTLAAQSAEPPNPLPSVKAIKCRFPAAASAVWKEGAPLPATRTQEMSFEVKEIDTQDGTAEYHGTSGRVFVSAVLSGWSMYFVESAVGQLNITTVFAQEASAKKLKAVHSRHGYLQMSIGKFVAEPSVSQSYGECEVTQ
jgi:hypothetical protein